MGTNRSSAEEVLFSRTRGRVIGLLFGQPQRSFYLTELIRLADVGRGAVQRELERLISAGLVNERRRGNQRIIQANRQSPLFPELEGLARKTVGLAATLSRALDQAREQITLAFVFGSMASGKAGPHSDVDLMLVGELRFESAARLLMDVHERVGREVNPAVMTEKEFRARASAGDGFLKRVLEQPKLFVMGGPDDLAQLVEDRPAR